MARRAQNESARSAEFSGGESVRGFFGRPTLVVFWFFVVAACVAVAIPAIPQYQVLKKIEAELVEARKEEARLREHSLQLKAEARALESNQKYLEARARDPLRYHLEGETVIQLGD